MTFRHTPLIAGLLLAGSVQAAEEHFDQLLALPLEDLMKIQVTISTDTKQTITKAPAVVSAISADDIKSTGATNLVELLENLPGVHVRSSYFANRPLVHFRGAKAAQTLLMVNGQPMKDLAWGFGVFWKGLPTSMIDRVEVIRGPGSARFGADASAGVINVITKTAGTIHGTEVGVRAGSFDSKAVTLQSGGEWNGYRLGLTAELAGTDGHDPFIGRDAEASAASLAPGNAGYGWNNADLRLSVARGNWKLLADTLRHDDLETGLVGNGVLDPVTRGSDSRHNLALLYDNDQFAGDWGLSAELRYQHLEYDSGSGFQEHPPGYKIALFPGPALNRQRVAEQQAGGEVRARYRGFEDHQVMLGVGHSWSDITEVEHWATNATTGVLENLTDTPNAFVPEQYRRNSYLFAQDIWTLAEDWELTLGARYDDYSDFGGTFNPRMALVWNSTDQLTTKLMYGQSFRPPSFPELYSPAGAYIALGNPGLEPEEAETWELAFTYAASPSLRVNLNLFQYNESNLITPDSTGQFQNSGEHRIHGAELEAWWQATDSLRLSGNYSLIDHDDANLFYGLPTREAYLRADWKFAPGWNWNLQANWSGEIERRATDPRGAIPDQWITDTSLRYSADKHWEVAATVKNLFDVDGRDYTGNAIPGDLPQPERSVLAEIRYKF